MIYPMVLFISMTLDPPLARTSSISSDPLASVLLLDCLPSHTDVVLADIFFEDFSSFCIVLILLCCFLPDYLGHSWAPFVSIRQ